jgi:hypothetical protein
MRSKLRSNPFVVAALVSILGGAVGATDVAIPGRIGMVRQGLFKIVSRPTGAFTIPGVGSDSDPLVAGGAVRVFDTDGSGVLFDDLLSGIWSGLGIPPGSSGYKYNNAAAPVGGDVKLIILKPTVIKIIAKGTGSLAAPIGMNLGVELTTGTDRRCAEFGGTFVVRNTTDVFIGRNAPAPAACRAPCCNDHQFFNFTTITAAGDCGDVLDATGMLVRNVNCAGLYTGGGGNSVPLPYALPDLGSAVTAVTGCAGDIVTIRGTSSTQTGSIKNCTEAGCLFGAPIAAPNPISTPTSYCLVNRITTAPSGTVDCATGATSISVPLDSEVYLTGDKNAAPGIQPCPRCIAGACVGGVNDMGACVPTAAINVGYPTSHDCPPDGSDKIGAMKMDFALTSGTVTWSGTQATNDTGSTASFQRRVFAGYCRDVSLPGGTGSFDADAMPGNQFKHCWENGMAVGTPCSQADNSAESCEQRSEGAFGPNGGANRTIRAIGNAMSIMSGPAAATLVSVFSIPPVYDATIDGAFDLPGPGAVAITGSARTCAAANPCP